MPQFSPSAILFDCDGVLVDSLGPAADAWDLWARTWAPSFDFRRDIEHGVRAADTVAALVAPDVYHEAVDALNRAELETTATTAPIPGATALTSSLLGLPWAVVTSAIRPLALARLSAAGHPLPPALVSADDVSQGKPSPEPYLQGAASLGIPIDECVVIEDAVAGVAAARAAGVRAVSGVGEKVAGDTVDALVEDLRAVHFRDGHLRVDG